jgi:hypothetical protein
LARLVAGSGGYAATVGGTVRIFGTTDVEVISLADTAGTVSFDSSFNRGGDFIILPNAANTYSISRVGSSVTLSDADSTITIPVGSKGSTLQFADGELTLKFGGQVLLGSQVISAASATITATLSAKTALPAATSATGTLITSANEPVLIGGNVRIFGTNGPDTVTIADVPGNLRFDGSFNRGGDTIVLNKLAESYSAARPDPSNIMIGDGDTKLTIPLGIKGLNVAFANEIRSLVYTNRNAYIGNGVVESIKKDLDKFENNIKFTLQPEAFKGSLPYPRINSDWPILLDINNDGFMDIVFHFKNLWWRDTSVNLTANIEIPNNIVFLINVNGEYFEDKTIDYLVGNSNAGGNFTSPVVVDVNNDGMLDILFGTNQEDGLRTEAANFGRLGALISDSGKYKIINFGDSLHYLDTFLARLDGKSYLLFHASGGTSSTLGGSIPWEFDNNTKQFVRSNISFPEVVGNAYQFLSIEGDSYLVRHNPIYGGFGLDGFSLNNGEWDPAGNIFNPFPFYRKAEFKSWNSVDSNMVDTYKWGDSYIVGYLSGATLCSVGSLKMYPDGPEIALIKVDTWKINNEDFENTLEIGDVSNVGILIGATFINGNMQLVNLNIENENFFSNYAGGAVSVRDFNRDGYDDIIVAKYSNTGYPADIYINNRNGGFYKLEYEIDIILERLAGQQATLFHDFNNDGNIDFILFPANGNNVESEIAPYLMNEFLYFSSTVSMFP